MQITGRDEFVTTAEHIIFENLADRGCMRTHSGESAKHNHWFANVNFFFFHTKIAIKNRFKI